MHIVRTERGWPAHFACAERCRFRRNTLVQCFDTAGRRLQAVVVSTVSLMVGPEGGEFEEIGAGRLGETMAFASLGNAIDAADISRQVSFHSPWRITEVDILKADAIHEQVVSEISNRLLDGSLVIPPAQQAED